MQNMFYIWFFESTWNIHFMKNLRYLVLVRTTFKFKHGNKTLFANLFTHRYLPDKCIRHFSFLNWLHWRSNHTTFRISHGMESFKSHWMGSFAWNESEMIKFVGTFIMRLAIDGLVLLVFLILASLVDRSMTLSNARAYFAFAWAVWAHFNVHPFNDHYWLVAINQLLNHCATELRNKHSRLFIANTYISTRIKETLRMMTQKRWFR